MDIEKIKNNFDFSEVVGKPVAIVSVGPSRDQTIIK